MFEEREVISLLLGVGVLLFALRQRDALRQIENGRFLFLALALTLASLACSVLEGLAAEWFFNLCQHIFSALSAILMAVWCRVTFAKSEVRA